MHLIIATFMTSNLDHKNGSKIMAKSLQFLSSILEKQWFVFGKLN